MWHLVFALFFIIGFCILHYLKGILRIKKLTANIPGPRTLPILGNALEFSSGLDGK